MIRRPRINALDLGILIVSFAILLLELLLTRVFSVVMYHHFAFLAVSLAMMGIALGGLIVNLRPRIFRADNVGSLAPLFAAAFAVTVILAAVVAFNMPIRLEATAANWRRVALILGLSLIPLSLGGVIIAHIFAFNADRAHRLYFFDLAGAGLACLLFVPLIGLVGAPTALLFTAAMAALGGAALASARHVRSGSMWLAGGLATLALLNTTATFFDLNFAKGGRAAPTLVTRWNSFSRVEVIGVPGMMKLQRRPMSWGFSSRLNTTARELHLLYDADALTQIVGFDGDLAKVRYLLWDVTAAAHLVRPNPNVLVIGAGGGRDVLAALAGGARSVTGVEINNITVDLMRGQFREYTGGLYVNTPNVTVHTLDGRSFVQRTNARYDLITASLVDTWAASSAGTYALAENSLYTVEAFSDYLAKLTPDGIVSFSRWYGEPPTEVHRVIALIRGALRSTGVTEPAGHVVVVRTDPLRTGRPSLATILMKKSPFTVAELQRLTAWSDAMLFDVAYLPPLTERRSSASVLDTLLGDATLAARFVATARADLSPTTDDRPFFFDRVPLAAWMAHRIGLPAPAYASESLPLASRILLIALAVTAGGTLLLIVLPLILRVERDDMPGSSQAMDAQPADSRSRDSLASGPHPTPRNRLSWIAWFGCLGLGYIVIEIVLIQRFNLYLGNPAYALTVVLFTMLLASGLGGLFAGRWAQRRSLASIVLVVCVALGVASAALTPMIYATIAMSPLVRVVLAVLVIAPLGFVMGMPFPTGLQQAGRVSPTLVPWAWAVNGGTSVLGSVLAVIVSMGAGFGASFMFGISAYVVALAIATVALQATRVNSSPAVSGSPWHGTPVRRNPNDHP